MSVSIKRTATQLIVSSPYNADLPEQARNAGGKWVRALSAWVFDIAAEPQVATVYRNVYGQWDDVIEEVSIACTCTNGASKICDSLKLAGRSIAYASGRDSGARTSDGVIVVSGGFTSGGSVKNWRTVARENTTFRVLHVPRPIAERLVSDPEWCDKIEIEQPIATEPINRELLISEREKLTARIAEIDALLNN